MRVMADAGGLRLPAVHIQKTHPQSGKEKHDKTNAG
jgi:hypothetical protein